MKINEESIVDPWEIVIEKTTAAPPVEDPWIPGLEAKGLEGPIPGIHPSNVSSPISC